jgi:hypothetical protein
MVTVGLPTLAASLLLLEMLREQQVIAEKVAPAPSALDVLMAATGSGWSRTVGWRPPRCCATRTSLAGSCRTVTGREVDVAGLTGATVSTFLLVECGRVSVGRPRAVWPNFGRC